MGKTEQEIEKILAGEKYSAPVLSKIFRKSSKRIARKVKAEDAELAKRTFTERQDSRKPIRQKEIEDAAWFHNLIHDLGKYAYHKMVKFVPWTDEDMNDYEHARKTLTGFVDNIHTLIEDSGKVQKLEDEKTYLEITLMKYQLVLNVAVERVKSLRQHNSTLIDNMTLESLLRALNQIIAAITMKGIPESMTQASTETG